MLINALRILLEAIDRRIRHTQLQRISPAFVIKKGGELIMLAKVTFIRGSEQINYSSKPSKEAQDTLKHRIQLFIRSEQKYSLRENTTA